MTGRLQPLGKIDIGLDVTPRAYRSNNDFHFLTFPAGNFQQDRWNRIKDTPNQRALAEQAAPGQDPNPTWLMILYAATP